MKAVIPYKHDLHNGIELKYAIRSLVKHFKPLSGIIIIGDLPGWYSGEHIFYPDTPKRKEYSIYTKLMQVQDNVLYTNDDYFALQDFDESLPNFYDIKCGDKHPVDRTYRDLYRNCPSEWLNFDIHCPMIIDTRLYSNYPIDWPIKSGYANQLKLQGTYMKDSKLRGECSYSEIKEDIRGRMFFSTNGNIHRGDMMKVMDELYPDKSIYEI